MSSITVSTGRSLEVKIPQVKKVMRNKSLAEQDLPQNLHSLLPH